MKRKPDGEEVRNAKKRQREHRSIMKAIASAHRAWERYIRSTRTS